MRTSIGLRRPRNSRLSFVLLFLLLGSVGTSATSPRANAQAVVAVTGSAYGVSVPNIIIFGGPQTPYGPTPTVTLPASGSATPLTAQDPSEDVAYGPFTLFVSGPDTVSTQGTPAGGSVTSSASIQSATTSVAGTCGHCVYAGPFTAVAVSSTCTATASQITAYTTITGGQLVTATDTSGNPTTSMTIPTNPPPNYSVSGYFYASSTDKETFTYVFNQETTNPNGSITVTAAHETLFGPTFKGDLYLGQDVCGVTTSPTAARVSTLHVKHRGRVLEMSWGAVRTSGVVGFVLFAGHHRLNARLVLTHRNPQYRYTTTWSGSGPYSLDVVLTNGTITP